MGEAQLHSAEPNDRMPSGPDILGPFLLCQEEGGPPWEHTTVCVLRGVGWGRMVGTEEE